MSVPDRILDEIINQHWGREVQPNASFYEPTDRAIVLPSVWNDDNGTPVNFETTIHCNSQLTGTHFVDQIRFDTRIGTLEGYVPDFEVTNTLNLSYSKYIFYALPADNNCRDIYIKSLSPLSEIVEGDGITAVLNEVHMQTTIGMHVRPILSYVQELDWQKADTEITQEIIESMIQQHTGKEKMQILNPKNLPGNTWHLH